MSAPRRKWATRLGPNDPYHVHASEGRAYQHVRALANKSAEITGTLVTVVVDNGNGWELFDRVDLEEVRKWRRSDYRCRRGTVEP